jgi:hypothetical protein
LWKNVGNVCRKFGAVTQPSKRMNGEKELFKKHAERIQSFERLY